MNHPWFKTQTGDGVKDSRQKEWNLAGFGKGIVKLLVFSWLISTGLLLFTPPHAAGQMDPVVPGTYYVDIGLGDDGNDGTQDTAGAWKTLHHAIEQINTGSPGQYSLFVAPGIYNTANGESDTPLSLTQDRVRIVGGATEDTLIQDGGALWKNGIEISASFTIVTRISITGFGPDEDRSGIAVTAGLGNRIDFCRLYENRQGVLITSSAQSTMIQYSNEIFRNDKAGIVIDGSQYNTIAGNSIHDNMAPAVEHGANILIQNGASNNYIFDNDILYTAVFQAITADRTGIWVENADSNEISTNMIAGCNQWIYPYGIYIIDSSPFIHNNTFHDNETTIYMASEGGDTSPLIENNLIFNSNWCAIKLDNEPGSPMAPEIHFNTLDKGIYGIYIYGGGATMPTIQYNILTHFTARGIDWIGLGGEFAEGVNWNNWWENDGGNYSWYTAAPDNISCDPQYAASGDYHLTSGSCCIDTISIGEVGILVDMDIEGEMRPQGAGYDMGCYEHPQPTVQFVTPGEFHSGVAVNTDIMATFSKEMNPVTLTTDTFYVSANATNIAGTVTCIGDIANFIPSAPLAYATTYTATLTTDIEDVFENGLLDNKVWSFTTEALPGDTTAPTVISVTPADSANDVALSTAVTVDFSEAMDQTTFTAGTFSVSDGTTNIAGTVTWGGNTATFTPSDSLAYATTYTATITTGAQDLAGNALLNNKVWSFTTKNPPADTTAPTVISVTPAEAANDVAVSTAVTVDFSEAMNPATLTTATFWVDDGTTYIAGTVTCSGNSATFTPSGSLAYDTTYTATITAGAEDLSGNGLSNAEGASFTTEDPPGDTTAPTVISVIPADSANDVAMSSAVTADFSEAMAPATFATGTFRVNDGTTDIAGTVTCSGSSVTFTPSGSLAYDTTYTATITTHAEDLSGNGLLNNEVWSFTTLSGQPPAQPIPAPGSEDHVVLAPGNVTLNGSPFSDPEGDEHVETYWLVRRADKMNFNPVILTGTDTGCAMPGLDDGLQYVWKVGYEDVGGNIAWSDESRFCVGSSQNDDSVEIPPGTTAGDFKMVSFVQWPDNPAMAEVVGHNVVSNTEDYRIGTYDPMIETYVVSGYGLEIEPGRAYWFLAREGLDISVDGVPVSIDTDIDVKLGYNTATQKGWNMVACPNNADYYWADIRIIVYDDMGNTLFGPVRVGDLASDNPYLDLHLWRWEGNTYLPGTTILEKYNGYWVRARAENVYLRFPSDDQVAAGGLGHALNLAMARGGRLAQSLLPKAAYADSDDSPPQPMSGLSADAGGNSGGSGCFISAAAMVSGDIDR